MLLKERLIRNPHTIRMPKPEKKLILSQQNLIRIPNNKYNFFYQN